MKHRRFPDRRAPATEVTVHRIVIVGLVVAVLISIGLPQPEGTHRVQALVVAGVAVAIAASLGDQRIWPIWRATGGVIAAAVLAWLFAVTGGTESIYQDAIVAVMVIAAVTLPGRLALGNIVAAAIATTSTWLYDSRADGVFAADAVADFAVWLAVTAGAFLQTRTLRDRRDALARSERIRDAFLRSMSHELRTPLTGILGFAETLELREEDLDPVRRRHVVGQLRASAARLATLIDDLLDVDRLTSGFDQADRRVVDVRDVVAGTVAAQGADPRIVLNLDPVVANVDGPKVARIVANLVSNARRHAAPDGRVTVTLRADERGTVLEVTDDGPGIAAGYEDEVFAPFVQGPERDADARPGPGLGLTLVRELAELHGGTARAWNVASGGACFEVVLPDTAITPPNLRSPREHDRGGRGRPRPRAR